MRFEDWSCDVGQLEFAKTSKSIEGAEFIPKPSGEILQTKRSSTKHLHLRDDSQKPADLKYISSHRNHQFDKCRSSKRNDEEQITGREKSRLDTKCRDSTVSLHRTASSICGCKERYKDERKSSVHAGSNVSQQSDTDMCKCYCCDSSLQGWQHLSVAGFEPRETAYVDGSQKNRCKCCCKSKTGRNIFSRRKGCECEHGKQNKHAAYGTPSELVCDRLGLFGSIPRSSALAAGKRSCQSLSRGSSCFSNDKQSTYSVGVSNDSQPLNDCPDKSKSPAERQVRKDLILQAFKVRNDRAHDT